MESNEERYRRTVEASEPPRPKAARPIVILGAGGIVRAAHLPAYAKAGFPVIAVADSASGKASELASERGIAHSFDTIEEAVRFAPSDAVFDVAVPASQITTILPHLPLALPSCCKSLWERPSRKQKLFGIFAVSGRWLQQSTSN
jgi:hypothetical protein